jgi:hypothetical protein
MCFQAETAESNHADSLAVKRNLIAAKEESSMVAKSYTLTFDGYWREPNIGGLPAKAGIYCAYACVFNAGAGTVTLNRLLYIGEAENQHDRVQGHEKWPTWRGKLKAGEEICFSVASIAGQEDRQRAEAAEIFKHKPPCNSRVR